MEGHPEQKKWGREMGYQLYFDKKKSWDFNSFKISLTNIRHGDFTISAWLGDKIGCKMCRRG